MMSDDEDEEDDLVDDLVDDGEGVWCGQVTYFILLSTNSHD